MSDFTCNNVVAPGSGKAMVHAGLFEGQRYGGYDVCEIKNIQEEVDTADACHDLFSGIVDSLRKKVAEEVEKTPQYHQTDQTAHEKNLIANFTKEYGNVESRK